MYHLRAWGFARQYVKVCWYVNTLWYSMWVGGFVGTDCGSTHARTTTYLCTFVSSPDKVPVRCWYDWVCTCIRTLGFVLVLKSRASRTERRPAEGVQVPLGRGLGLVATQRADLHVEQLWREDARLHKS